MTKERILGFDITTLNEDELIKNIFIDYKNEEQLFIVNINPEILVTNYKDEEKKKIFNLQKYQIPDGNGIVWASKKQKGNINKRITGIDLMQRICDNSQKYNSKIYLYGGKKEIAEKAKKELENKYEHINIVGTCDGYSCEQNAIDDIMKCNPDIVFVGLGSPKQEEFIIKNMDNMKSVKIFMPVGGSFDIISKSKKRAPKCIINLHLEWLYRTLQEPKRIFRQGKLVRFILLVLKNKDRSQKNV